MGLILDSNPEVVYDLAKSDHERKKLAKQNVAVAALEKISNDKYELDNIINTIFINKFLPTLETEKLKYPELNNPNKEHLLKVFNRIEEKLFKENPMVKQPIQSPVEEEKKEQTIYA